MGENGDSVKRISKARPLSNETWVRYGEILDATIVMILSSRAYKEWILRFRIQERWRIGKLKRELNR
jgi:hypothetical protein